LLNEGPACTVRAPLDRPIEDHRPDGSVWRTTYDATGAIATRVDGRGKTTSYTYDHQHRLHAKTDPLGRATTYDYDGAGDLVSAERPDGSTRALSYDDAGRLTGVDESGGTSDDAGFTYDADGDRTSMTDGTGTTSYTYDVAGRLQSQRSAAGQTTTYHYDSWSRVTSIDYPDALSVVATGSAPAHVSTGTVTRSYDGDDDLTGVTDWLGHTTTFAYDGDDDLSGVTRPNGVDATYGYDDVDALTSITDDTPATSLARDDERQLSGTDDGTSPTSLSYDDADRLTSAVGRAYAYDDSDDLTQTATAAGAPVTQQFDDAGELTGRTTAGIPVATLGYDDDGQRTSMTPSGGGGATTYAWTHAGRLASYTGPDLTGGGATTATESYTYDGDGLRQTVTTGDQRRHEAWDISGSTPLMITDGPTSYVTGPGGLPVEQIAADGTVRYFSHDQLGSTTALTDADGTTAQRYSYDAYGQLTSATPTIENPFQFAGQLTDATTGLQYLRARYYDPSTGQFLSRDPLEGDTLQPYAYANDNPTNDVDPNGMFSVKELWADGEEAVSRGLEGALGEADGITSVLTSATSK
jgi:RHS repeat-associated protein